MKIFLIGLPGSGKTTLGKKIAQKLNLPFVDLDLEIETLEGKTIQKVFAEKTEKYFREVESSVLKKFCSDKTDFVMATGGGTPCFFDNVSIMNQTGATIFLDVPTDEISLRLQNEKLEDRPLFSQIRSSELKDKIDKLRDDRISFYNQSQFIFSGDKISADEIISKIKD